MSMSDWFLLGSERGNVATRIDSGHPEDQVELSITHLTRTVRDRASTRQLPEVA